ncbi:MAG: universal stress protein [Kofleriaceae bacterium]|nr:universal stress protein [Kofleriaceae bacterium]
MSETSRRFQIVVGVDLSEYAPTVLLHAADQAARHDHPTLHLLTAVSDDHGVWRHPTEAALAEVEADARTKLFGLAQRVLEDAMPDDAKDRWAVRLYVRRGRPDEQLVDLAAEVEADLLVVGRFGHSHGRRRLRRVGSVADTVVVAADCPVLVVHPPRERGSQDAQCPDCVKIRRDTAGETWFCSRHHGDRVGHTMSLIGGPLGRGGTMW